jgi:hypothetical protein
MIDQNIFQLEVSNALSWYNVHIYDQLVSIKNILIDIHIQNTRYQLEVSYLFAKYFDM